MTIIYSSKTNTFYHFRDLYPHFMNFHNFFYYYYYYLRPIQISDQQKSTHTHIFSNHANQSKIGTMNWVNYVIKCAWLSRTMKKDINTITEFLLIIKNIFERETTIRWSARAHSILNTHDNTHKTSAHRHNRNGTTHKLGAASQSHNIVHGRLDTMKTL